MRVPVVLALAAVLAGPAVAVAAPPPWEWAVGVAAEAGARGEILPCT
jgi:hypothetical protein